MLIFVIFIISVMVLSFIVSYFCTVYRNYKLKKIYTAIIQNSGILRQKNDCCDMLESLRQEILLDVIRKGTNKQHIRRKLAKVCNAINQLIILYDIDSDKLEEIMFWEMNQQVKRVKQYPATYTTYDTKKKTCSNCYHSKVEDSILLCGDIEKEDFNTCYGWSEKKSE